MLLPSFLFCILCQNSTTFFQILPFQGFTEQHHDQYTMSNHLGGSDRNGLLQVVDLKSDTDTTARMAGAGDYGPESERSIRRVAPVGTFVARPPKHRLQLVPDSGLRPRAVLVRPDLCPGFVPAHGAMPARTVTPPRSSASSIVTSVGHQSAHLPFRRPRFDFGSPAARPWTSAEPAGLDRSRSSGTPPCSYSTSAP